MLVACSSAPVEWGELEYLAPAGETPSAVEHQGFCGVREARLGELRWRAGWREGTGELTFVLSTDAAATWDGPVVADDRDPGARVCERPAPSVFADSSNDFLHGAYSIEAPGAPGVYYVHSMAAAQLEQRGAGMFEQPWAIRYGARRVRTSVASRGDTVVVAYEDPNSARGPVHLAISATAGHSFGWHTTVPASDGGVLPDVGLRAGEIAVTWREGTEAGRRVLRRGTFR